MRCLQYFVDSERLLRRRDTPMEQRKRPVDSNFEEVLHARVWHRIYLMALRAGRKTLRQRKRCHQTKCKLFTENISRNRNNRMEMPVEPPAFLGVSIYRSPL